MTGEDRTGEDRTGKDVTSEEGSKLGASFQYADSPDPIRSDLAEAHRRAWQHVASPGTWLTAEERVAVADETRLARGCTLCRKRKAALSPFAIDGDHNDHNDHIDHIDHNDAGLLPEALVDAIHRITTDAARLTEHWLQSLFERGITAESYVEAVGVAVCVISVDRFHDAMGLPREPLPAPQPGEPSRVGPKDATPGEAWVPMLSGKRAAEEVGMNVPSAPFVVRALSLVPDELRAWQNLSAAQYVPLDKMLDFGRVRSLARSQIELVAGRVSRLNDCFY